MLFHELFFESTHIIPLAKNVANQQEANECLKAKGMNDVVIILIKSGQRASSTTALGLYCGSLLRDTKGEA